MLRASPVPFRFAPAELVAIASTMLAQQDYRLGDGALPALERYLEFLADAAGGTRSAASPVRISAPPVPS